MRAMPDGANPAVLNTENPMRSASRSMSREKLSWPCTAAAWPPRMAACAASGLLRAASTPRISPANASRPWRWLVVTLRAMWRCVTCDSSCASTDASSSADEVRLIIARCTPT